MQVVVFGASGMLGSMLVRVFAASGADVRGTVRDRARAASIGGPRVDLLEMDAAGADAATLAAVIDRADVAVNAIGVIKSQIRDDRSADVARAIAVNATFPHVLARAAERTGTRVLQIATDCVYSGARGRYTETDPHDPLDVYGKTKSLGEVRSPLVHHLRCSIVGPELRTHSSLLDWFRRQPRGATVTGYTNHHWNGVTTWHFARLCVGVATTGVALPAVQHVVPGDALSKADLLRAFARAFRRDDLTIVPGATPVGVDRTLATLDPPTNQRLWAAAGYDTPPRLATMVDELARATEEMAIPQ